MKTFLIGNGYWGNIIKQKLDKLTNLIKVIDTSFDLENELKFLKVNMITICTPTETHYDLVKRCLDADTDIIFCEKPFTGDYHKAKELFDIAKEKNIDIIVDNTFLYRKEFLNIDIKDLQDISFIWNKRDDRCHESLFDSLLYHDIYLLMELTNYTDFNIENLNITDKVLELNISNNDIKCSFNYNRNSDTKEKKVILDGDVVDFTNPLNDPLFDMIQEIKEDDFLVEQNKKITLKTLKLIKKIKNHE